MDENQNFKSKDMKIARTFLFILIIQSCFYFTSSAQKQFKALLVTTTRGWHHESIHAGVLALQELGKKNSFDCCFI